MKKLFILFLIAGITVSCNNRKKEGKEVRYTQDSEEINTFKSAIRDYENSDWEAFRKHYADTAKIYHNSEEGKSAKQIAALHKQSLAGLSSYGFEDDEDEFEMVVTDDDETWVNYWGTWKGTISENNKEVVIPVHLTARFVDGKIVKEYGYWDESKMMVAMQEVDSARTKQDSIQGSSN